MFVCPKCSSGCDSFDDLQVHMLTVHHDEGSPQPETAMNVDATVVAEPPRELRKCSATNCENRETDEVKFKLCAPCKEAGKKVPYCSR